MGGRILSGTRREWADLDDYSRRSNIETLIRILVEKICNHFDAF